MKPHIKPVSRWKRRDGTIAETAYLIRMDRTFVVVEDPRAFAHQLLKELDR